MHPSCISIRFLHIIFRALTLFKKIINKWHKSVSVKDIPLKPIIYLDPRKRDTSISNKICWYADMDVDLHQGLFAFPFMVIELLADKWDEFFFLLFRMGEIILGLLIILKIYFKKFQLQRVLFWNLWLHFRNSSFGLIFLWQDIFLYLKLVALKLHHLSHTKPLNPIAFFENFIFMYFLPFSLPTN